MFHHPDCQKYRLWKREQLKKSKGLPVKSRKRKKKELVTDCIEEERIEEAERTKLKIDYSRCKKKRRVYARQLIGQPFKRVSLAEVLLKKIKPSIEEREQFINPRHNACLTDSVSEIDLIPAEETGTDSYDESSYAKDGRKIRRKKGGRKATKSAKDEDKVDKTARTGETLKKDKSDAGLKDGGNMEGGEESKVQSERKTKKSRRRKKGRKRIREPRSDEDSECETVCSFDSEVCLAGLKLSAADKKKLDGYRRQTRSSTREQRK